MCSPILFIGTCAHANLHLDVSGPSEIQLGHKLRITVTLVNGGAEPVRVPMFHSPEALNLDVSFAYPDGTNGNSALGWLANSSVHTMQDGMRVWLGIPKEIKELAPGEQCQETIDLTQMARYPCAGHYRLRLSYDQALPAELPFEVTFLPERDMPRHIEMAAASWESLDAKVLLMTVTQWPLFANYNPAPNDSVRKVRTESAAIRRGGSRTS